jgi:hypothetical protein
MGGLHRELRWPRPGKAARLLVGACVGVLAASPQLGRAEPDFEIRTIALSGQQAPDGQGTIAGLRTAPPLLNSQGQLLFIADLHAMDAEIDAHAVLRSHRPGELLQLLRTGDPLPDGASFGWLRSAEDICLHDTGQAAVHVPVDADDRPLNIIYRLAPSGGIASVHDADRHRGLRMSFGLTDAGAIELGADGPPSAVFNALGQVAFEAQDGIYLAGPDGSVRRVVGRGDELAGGRVVEILFAGDQPCRSGFNDMGQVAFYARLATGDGERDGIFLAATGDGARH